MYYIPSSRPPEAFYSDPQMRRVNKSENVYYQELILNINNDALNNSVNILDEVKHSFLE